MIDKKKYTESIVYVCNYCGKNYGDLENLGIHLEECVYNFDDSHTCLTCEHANIHLVPPYGNTNGYSSQRLLEVVGNRSYITCNNNIYNGKISEEKIMRENKSCYKGITEFRDFSITKDKDWLEYTENLKEIREEQDEIDLNLNRIKEESQVS